MKKVKPRDRFGRLTVLENHSSTVRANGKAGERKWLCLCDCGSFFTARTSNLTSGNTKSCGCYKSEQTTKSNKNRDNWKDEDAAYQCSCGSLVFHVLRSKEVECSSCNIRLKMSDIFKQPLHR